ncbi:MAG: imidazole glycerol phosphate synthase subunit HisH [Candidatus Acidiferrales bacterium]
MSARRIALVDYGAGNLPSVERAFRRLGANTVRVTAPEELAGAAAIVLPGVGHFAALSRALVTQRLIEPLREALASGVPFLGICLGMQALYETSEEAPSEPGLGFLPGTVFRLPHDVKLPHMGWNELRRTGSSALLGPDTEFARFYFAHSYAAPVSGEATAVCEHGAEFAAIVEDQRRFGVQFHPEKSGEAGLRILRRFLEVVP